MESPGKVGGQTKTTSNLIRTGLWIGLSVLLSWVLSALIVTEAARSSPWGLECDAESYWDLSGNILTRGEFADSPNLGHVFINYPNEKFIGNIHRLPAYPLALALFRSVWNDIDIGYLLNFAIYLQTLVYAVAIYRLIHPSAATSSCIVLSLFLALSPLYLVYNYGIQSDTFCAGMGIGFTYHFLRTQREFATSGLSRRYWWQPGLAALYGSACLLSRANAVIYLALPAIYGVVAARQATWRVFAGNCLVLGSLLASGGSWALRNYELCGEFLLSDASGNNLYLNYVYYNAKPREAVYQWRDNARRAFMRQEIEVAHRAPLEAEAVTQNQLKKIALAYINDHRKQSLRIAVDGVEGLFLYSYYDLADILSARLFHLNLIDNHQLDPASLSTLSQSEALVCRLLRKAHFAYKYAMMLAVLAFPVVLLKRSPNRPWLLILWLSSSLFVLATGSVIASGDRLRLPVHWLHCLFVALMMKRGLEWSIRWTAGPPGTAMVVSAPKPRGPVLVWRTELSNRTKAAA